MSDTKFTPGPWVAVMEDGFGEPAPYMQVLPADRMMFGHKSSISIAMMFCMEMVEQQSNAHLIAAAPDLFADLEDAAAQLRKYEALHRAKGTADSTAKAEVNAALADRFERTLAKARGEP